MKKLALTILLSIIFAAYAWAIIPGTISQAVTTAGYVAVRLPVDTGCTSWSISTEDGAAIWISSDSAGADGVKWTSDGSAIIPFGYPQVLPPDAAGTILFYAKGTSSTNVVGLFTKSK